MFDDVLDRNEGFLDHKNVILTKQKNERFSSGVKSWFWSKIWNLLAFFFSKKTLDMTFHDVLEKKEGFLDYKKGHFHIFEKYDFSQNLTFLLSLFFSEKDSDMMLSNYFFLFTKKALMWCLMI